MVTFRPRNLTELLQIIWRGKWLILFVAGIVWVAALIVVVRLPDVYESRALIVVSPPQSEAQSSGPLIASVTEQISSRSNLESLIRRHHLYSYQPEMKMDPLIDAMRKQVKLETKFRGDYNGFPESFTISYRNDDPTIARQVVTDMVSIFADTNEIVAKHAADEEKGLNAEIAVVEARLSQASRSRRDSTARSASAGRALDNLGRAHAERRASASSLEALGDKQYLLDRQIADQRRLISQQQQLVRTAPPSEARAATPYAGLLRHKTELETQLQNFTADYTEKNPKVIQAREQLADVNRRIAQLTAEGEQTRSVASSSEAQELRTMERELARLDIELDVVRREVNRKRQRTGNGTGTTARTLPAGGTPIAGPAGASELSGTELEFDTLRGRYEALLERQNSVRKSSASGGALGSALFQFVDRPNLPQQTSGPNRVTMLLVSLIVALLIGLVVAAAIELRKLFSINDERDVNYYLGVPVVALIPEAFTTSERLRAAGAARKRLVGLLLLGAVLTPVLALLLTGLGVFLIVPNK